MICFRSLLAVSIACCTVPKLALAEEGYFDSKGVRIHYVKEGVGEPIILIHGWMGDSGMWGQDSHGNTKLDTSSVPGFEVIALDCRGHGKSGKPHDEPKPSLALANAFANVMYGGKDVQAFAASGLSFDKLKVSLSELRKCKAPILFIYGSREPESLKAKVAKLSKELNGVEIKEVEGGDHMTTLTKSEFGLSVVQFLKSNRLGG